MIRAISPRKYKKGLFISMCYNSHNNREYIQSNLCEVRAKEARNSPFLKSWSDYFFAAICTMSTTD